MKSFAFLLALTLPAAAAHIELVAGGGAKEKDAPAAECVLHEPFGVEFTRAGEMVIVEMEHGNRVLKVDAQGMLRVIAGTGAKGFSGNGGPATAATFGGIPKPPITPPGEPLPPGRFNQHLPQI